MKSFFLNLFEYNHHVNQKLSDVFAANPAKISRRSIKLYSHILDAHHIWNNRISQNKPAFGVWHEHPATAFKQIDQENYEHSLRLLELPDLHKTIRYSNSKKLEFTNAIADILFHIINHSTYHRGQLATDFRQNGIEPLVTDYTFYKR